MVWSQKIAESGWLADTPSHNVYTILALMHAPTHVHDHAWSKHPTMVAFVEVVHPA